MSATQTSPALDTSISSYALIHKKASYDLIELELDTWYENYSQRTGKQTKQQKAKVGGVTGIMRIVARKLIRLLPKDLERQKVEIPIFYNACVEQGEFCLFTNRKQLAFSSKGSQLKKLASLATISNALNALIEIGIILRKEFLGKKKNFRLFLNPKFIVCRKKIAELQKNETPILSGFKDSKIKNLDTSLKVKSSVLKNMDTLTPQDVENGFQSIGNEKETQNGADCVCDSIGNNKRDEHLQIIVPNATENADNLTVRLKKLHQIEGDMLRQQNLKDEFFFYKNKLWEQAQQSLYAYREQPFDVHTAELAKDLLQVHLEAAQASISQQLSKRITAFREQCEAQDLDAQERWRKKLEQQNIELAQQNKKLKNIDYELRQMAKQQADKLLDKMRKFQQKSCNQDTMGQAYSLLSRALQLAYNNLEKLSKKNNKPCRAYHPKAFFSLPYCFEGAIKWALDEYQSAQLRLGNKDNSRYAHTAVRRKIFAFVAKIALTYQKEGAGASYREFETLHSNLREFIRPMVKEGQLDINQGEQYLADFGNQVNTLFDNYPKT